MKPIRVTPPFDLPVTIGEVRAQARIDYADEDAVLEGMIRAAVALLDGYGGLLGRAIMEQTWRLPVCTLPRGLRLPMPDVRDVVVSYRDTAGAGQTLAATDFEVIEEHLGPTLYPRDAFTAPNVWADQRYPIDVTFTAGADDPADVDQRIKLAIVMLVTHWDANRAATTEERQSQVPWGVDELIAPLRWRSL